MAYGKCWEPDPSVAILGQLPLCLLPINMRKGYPIWNCDCRKLILQAWRSDIAPTVNLLHPEKLRLYNEHKRDTFDTLLSLNYDVLIFMFLVSLVSFGVGGKEGLFSILFFYYLFVHVFLSHSEKQ